MYLPDPVLTMLGKIRHHPNHGIIVRLISIRRSEDL